MSSSDETGKGGAGSPLRDLLRVAADQAAAVAENVERVYRSSFVSTDTLPGVYRGTVTSDEDPLARGRLQVAVPEAGSDPAWAEVAQRLDGAGAARADATADESVGAIVGAVVWVAFERGSPSSPVVLGRLGG